MTVTCEMPQRIRHSAQLCDLSFELRDVPYVQYFHEGYALHAAYWHDRFGIPRSHGCINLSPDNASWYFNQVHIGDPIVINA